MDALTPQTKALSAFCVLPSARFGEQDADETVALMLRASPFTQIPWVFNMIVAAILLVIINMLLGTDVLNRVALRIDLIAAVAIVLYGFYNFLIWYYTVGFVTNKRIVDIDYHGVVKRVVSQAPMIKVADVTSKSAGFFGQILNYGNVFVQTEGVVQNIEFDQTPNPDEAVAIINDIATTVKG